MKFGHNDEALLARSSVDRLYVELLWVGKS